MKIRMGLLMASLILSVAVSACDVCGCYLSLYPQDRSNYVSLLYKNRTLAGQVFSLAQTKHGSENLLEGDYLELYSTLEFRASVFLSERVYLLASIPVVNRFRSIDKEWTADTYALGDPLLMAHYMAHDKESEAASGISTRLTLGLGLKIPLGRTDLSYNGVELDRDMQAGTGSWDPTASVAFLARKGKWGVGLQWIGGFSGSDPSNDRYGHNQNLSIEPFVVITGEKLSVAPSIGAYFEQYGNERENGLLVESTSGSVFFGKIGVRVWHGQWQIQTEVQLALAEEHASIVPANKFRVIAGLSYYLPTRKDT